MRPLIVAAVLALSASSQAAADIIYQYTGLPFTSASSPYTTSDFVSISLTLANPLPANLSDSNILPLVKTYTFTDGVQTITPTVAQTQNPPIFMVSTDANGTLTAWYMAAFLPAVQYQNGLGTPQIFSCTGATLGDPNCHVENIDLGAVFFPTSQSNGSVLSLGTWTPEPSSALLMASGVVGLALRRRRSAAR